MEKLLFGFMILIGSTSFIKAADFGNLSGYSNKWCYLEINLKTQSLSMENKLNFYHFVSRASHCEYLEVNSSYLQVFI